MASGGYTTRKAAFKQLDSAIGNLETAMYHLLNIKNVYEPEHPEIAHTCQVAMELTQSIQNLLVKFRTTF